MRQYLDAAERAHPALTRMNQAVGDGDFGDNLLGALRLVDSRIPDGTDLPTELAAASAGFLDEVGGTSGPLIGLLLQDVAAHLAGPGDVDEALLAGLADETAAISRLGEARVGDRTMLDCLGPTLADAADLPRPLDWVAVAARALDHARAAGPAARAGRASYVGERAIGTPDAGVVGLVSQRVGEPVHVIALAIGVGVMAVAEPLGQVLGEVADTPACVFGPGEDALSIELGAEPGHMHRVLVRAGGVQGVVPVG